jgi:HEAT repeat protein
MNDNGKNRLDLPPKERVAFLESLIEHSPAWADNKAIFIQYLDDEDPDVRAMAIRGLWFSPSPALLDRLIEMADQDPSPLVRARAISGLGIFVYEGEMADYDFDWGPMTELMREGEIPQADFVRTRDFLLSVYADETRSLDERRFAVEALGFLSDPEIADLIQEAYNRPEREMKISALFAMGRSGLARWVEILGTELYNSDHDIQREAIRAVGEIGMDELGKDLWRLTFAEERETKLEAILALGQTGWEEGFERLDDLTTDPDPEIAEFAQEALEEWLFMDELLSHADEFDDETEFEDWDLDDLEPDWDQDDSIDS